MPLRAHLPCPQMGDSGDTTLMGLGSFPGDDGLSLGMLGMHGTYRANMAVTNCDLLVGVGARFDDRVTGKVNEFAPLAKRIHIDIDPTSISKNVPVDIPIVGDVKAILKQLIEILKKEDKAKSHRETRAEWLEQINEWKRSFPLTYIQKEVIKPQYVVEKIFEATGGARLLPLKSVKTDVDRTVLQIHNASVAAHLRRTRYHGLWITCSHRSPGCFSGRW